MNNGYVLPELTSSQLSLPSLPRARMRSKGLCDRSWCLYILYIVYKSALFFWNQIFYFSLSELYLNTDRLLIEFNGLWYSLASRQVFMADLHGARVDPMPAYSRIDFLCCSVSLHLKGTWETQNHQAFCVSLGLYHSH